MIKWTLSLILLLNVNAFAQNKTICGSEDDRKPSFDLKVGRLNSEIGNGGCTVTMIGSTCAISAGHCKSTFVNAEFNTPETDKNGFAPTSKPEDIYKIDKSSIDYETGMGNDWAVLKIKANEITGKFPGDVYGHYNVNFDKEIDSGTVRITGYGYSSNSKRSFIQQENAGEIMERKETSYGEILTYRVDTMGGNSGSSVIDVNSNEVIAIHTHGGCRSTGETTANKGTYIATNDELVKAIKACLASEE
jgi:V8-like Glu-specific endopeptidase